MTIDRFSNLWVCHFGGACISVFNNKGKKIHKVKLPAKNITNCTFNDQQQLHRGCNSCNFVFLF